MSSIITDAANGAVTEFHHAEALRKTAGRPLTTGFWLPDADFDSGGVGTPVTRVDPQ